MPQGGSGKNNEPARLMLNMINRAGFWDSSWELEELDLVRFSGTRRLFRSSKPGPPAGRPSGGGSTTFSVVPCGGT